MHRRAFVLAITLLLAACAQQPQRNLVRPAREAITSFVLEGRVSVKRGSEARQAGITWKRAGEREDIALSGPLGQQAAHLWRDQHGARLDTADHQSYTAADWESLSERVLGVALPLDNLSRWITGAGATEVLERDGAGRQARATADGWRIDYLGYESDSFDALPILIELQRDDIRVRLKVDQWQTD